MHKIIRTALFAGTAMAAVATGMPQEAAAQSQMPGFFGSLSGWYYLDSGSDRTSYQKRNFKGASHPDDGFGGKVYLGYRFMGSLDLAFGFQGSQLNGKKEAFPSAKATTKAHYWAVDGEIGYNTMLGGAGLRLFAGARYAQFDHRSKFFGSIDGQFFKSYNNDYSGIGPRIGADFSTRLGNSNFSIFGDVAGSVLFGTLKGHHEQLFCGSGCTSDDKGSRTVFNAEGQLGLGYEIAPAVTIGAGYRVEYWDGVADKTFVPSGSSLSRSGRSDRLMHGPFARLSYNFGAPRLMPIAAVVPPPPQPPVAAGKGFIVFFDFDRSNITAPAQKIINDAIAAAKAGGSTRVTLTGHTDRSGSEQYNQALSVRRGEAVKAAMIRGGIPANAIVVIGRGESAPLVPTADGVREPQNRRVEILI